ncbi:GGDEF domain-containing protein [Paludibacterium sp.]|uniref:GGDEF domain-containing protein n=1 Tax=Paludibacterium sp. TaxID=1917523 RepID=UPI0025F12711|nr:GGDEF domain-containing protein [Paludibacterium sp.]
MRDSKIPWVWAMTTTNPIEVARETLKQLSVRKLLPTPENFERVYNELSHAAPQNRESRLASQLVRAIESQASQSAPSRLLLSKLQQAAAEERWEQLPQLAVDCMREALKDVELAQSWGSLISELIRAWDMRVPDLPQHFKQTALERVLINYGNQPEELNRKLDALVANWGRPQGPRAQLMATADDETPVDEAADAVESADLPQRSFDDLSWRAWQQLLAYTLKHGLEPRLTNTPELQHDLDALIAELEDLEGADALSAYMPRLRALMIKLELQTQQEGRLVNGLSSLLKLMLDNVAELNQGDGFLVGQIASLQELLGQQPISMQQLYQLETSLREVIRKQGNLKQSLDEAANSLRSLLDSFISRLSAITDSTDDFQHKISQHSLRLKETTDVGELNHIIADLVEDTVEMQEGLSHSRDELVTAKGQVEAAEQRIKELEQALETASAKVREDQLTGAYNRRGLAEHFQREISRTERSKSPLSVALIDVDNFKRLNDHYGHLTGDDALIYLVDVIRNNIRPADVVARFGGEEFVLLMPDTNHDEAMETIRRLQRELTKTFFLANNDRLVITFSAGVAQWHLGERDIDVIERADQAMYQAKLAGKNRVTSAEEGLGQPL